MGHKKDLKYYLMILGIAALAILLYAIFNWISTGQLDTGVLLLVVVIPVVFTLFLFVFDKVFEKIFPKQKKKNDEKSSYDAFLAKMNLALNRETDFSIHDYRTLQDSEKFQKTLHQLYTIKTEGENPDLTYEYLGKKFKKSTIEYKAVKIIIEEAKKID